MHHAAVERSVDLSAVVMVRESVGGGVTAVLMRDTDAS